MGYGTRRHGRKTDGLESMKTLSLSRKSDTIFGQGTIPEPSTSHIGKRVALVALAAAFVYIYARIPQIAEMTVSFYATLQVPRSRFFSMPSAECPLATALSSGGSVLVVIPMSSNFATLY